MASDAGRFPSGTGGAVAVADLRPITTLNGHAAAGQPRVWPIHDLLAADLPVPEPLIAGILDAESANNWGGPSGTGKTWFALDAALSIATGRDWLGRFPVEQAPVLIIDQENHLARLQERLRLLTRAQPVPPQTPLWLATRHGLYLDDPAGYAWLDAQLRQYQPVVVVLDSFTRFHRGQENDSGHMADVNATIRQLMQDHGVAVVLLDHTRKRGPNNDPEERLRGSNEKRAFVDAALDLEASKDPQPVVTVTQTKRRYGPPLAPFAVRLEVDTAAHMARLVYQGESTKDRGARQHDVIAAIRAIQDQAGPDAADVNAIAGWLDIGPSTARRHADRLGEAGLVITRTVRTAGRPKQIYDVVGGNDA